MATPYAVTEGPLMARSWGRGLSGTPMQPLASGVSAAVSLRMASFCGSPTWRRDTFGDLLPELDAKTLP